MIHEILPHRFDNSFITTIDFGEEDFVFHFHQNLLLLKIISDDFEIPRKKDIPEIKSSTERTFIFKLDGHSCFLIRDCPITENDRFVYKEINFVRTLKQKEITWICMLGFQLMNWYTQNKFCGKCGTETKEKTDERAIICPACNNIVYPKISPAIIVAIVNKDKILLARNSAFINNWFSHVAGYADVGESLENAVIREVKEEVGLDVKNIRYYKSQPWPFSGSMMIGFFAEADVNQEIRIDNKEITEAAWFTRGNLPDHPTTFSIAGEMIEIFENGEL